jgi:hypothetical protein
MLAQALAARNLELEEVFPDPKYARRFVDSMPSADVCVSLITAAHRNPQTRWTGNDMFDIDALGVAVPYCDVVVTERHARHALEIAGAPARSGTAVMATLRILAREAACGATLLPAPRSANRLPDPPSDRAGRAGLVARAFHVRCYGRRRPAQGAR